MTKLTTELKPGDWLERYPGAPRHENERVVSIDMPKEPGCVVATLWVSRHPEGPATNWFWSGLRAVHTLVDYK